MNALPSLALEDLRDSGPMTNSVGIVVSIFGDLDRWMPLAERALESAWAQATPAAETSLSTSATLHEARNAGVAGLQTDWVCHLDADDELEPSYLTAMAAAIGTCAFADPTCPCQDGDVCHYVDVPGSPAMPPPSPKLLVPAVRYVHPDGHAEAPRIPDADRPLIDVNRAVIGTLIPHALFGALGGFRDWEIYEDWDLWLRAVCAGAQLVEVPDAIYRAHISPQSRNQARRALRERTYWAIRREHEACAGTT